MQMSSQVAFPRRTLWNWLARGNCWSWLCMCVRWFACTLTCLCKQMRPPLFFLLLTFTNRVYNNEDRVSWEIQFAAPTGELEKPFLSLRRGVKNVIFRINKGFLKKRKRKNSVMVLWLPFSKKVNAFKTELLGLAFLSLHTSRKIREVFVVCFQSVITPRVGVTS